MNCKADESLENCENLAYSGATRGCLERWKRGVDSSGVRYAISYALEAYGAASDSNVSQFIVDNGVITTDQLTAGGLRMWLTGHDPVTGVERDQQRLSPDADLLLDGTLNHPKSYSLAALLQPKLAVEFEALQDRLLERVFIWQTELNARCRNGGRVREEVTALRS